jgi:hypothetical protein
MGTRNLTKVVMGGETVVAQYGQWDGYPEGQGITAFNFVKNQENLWALEMGLQRVYYPTQEQLEEMSKPFEDGHSDGWMTYESGKAFGEKYPSLTRDTCASILYVIAESKEVVPLQLDTEFEQDTLFCEGMYEVNLDTKVFTSYFGHNDDGSWDYVVAVPFSEAASMSNEEYLALFKKEDELV